MVVVSHLLLTILMPLIDRARVGVPQECGPKDSVSVLILQLAILGFYLAIDQPYRILLIGGPDVSVFVPDRIEVSASDHEIVRLLDHELRKYVGRILLVGLCRHYYKIEHCIRYPPFLQIYVYNYASPSITSRRYQHI